MLLLACVLSRQGFYRNIHFLSYRNIHSYLIRHFDFFIEVCILRLSIYVSIEAT